MTRQNPIEDTVLRRTQPELILLLQQTGTVFLGCILILLLTGGTPPPLTIGVIFFGGIGWVAWMEKRNRTTHQATYTEVDTHRPHTKYSLDNQTTEKKEQASEYLEEQTRNKERVAIFIDGSNLFYAALQLGIEIDYKKLLETLTGEQHLFRAFFYTGIDRTNEKQQGFLLWMRRNGYRVVAKDLVQLTDGSKKANLDVEITVDMLALEKVYDTAILVSGDGDLAYAVDAISQKGIKVCVVSLRAMTSDSLINVSDQYVDLDDIKEYIRKANLDSTEADSLSPRSYKYRSIDAIPNPVATDKETKKT
jgi:uncharacterized LabA/DUF88 family protein